MGAGEVSLLQITPSLPRPSEGVGSYSLALGSALGGIDGSGSHFVVGDPLWLTRARADAFTSVVSSRTSHALLQVMRTRLDTARSGVLIHYVNYGYARRGCPWWLIRGLARFRARSPGQKLVTVFHEVYAFGPPWRSSFWLWPVQRHLAAQLARLSDGIVTSLERYAAILRRWRPDTPIRLLPVFSTVGEPRAASQLSQREPLLVVFGGQGVRRRAYTAYRSELEAACRALEIGGVIDIGPPVESATTTIGGRAVRRLGILPAEEVGAWLQRARAGFIAYPTGFLGKSTIFAAYAAHGVIPVVAWDRHQPDESARQWLEYVPARELNVSDRARAAEVATAATAWYEGHSLAKQAELFAGLLFGEAGSA